MQIIDELRIKYGPSSAAYSMAPMAHWPRSAAAAYSKEVDGVSFIGYLNLVVVKHLIFAVRLLIRLLTLKPQLCVQYNSYFFENIALIIYRNMRPSSSLAIIIQDVHAQKSERLLSKRWMRSWSERASLYLARRFDVIVPISSAIVDDFRFDPAKCIVFQGGVTDFALKLMRDTDRHLEPIGVFAGALEPHNGIDRLVDQWVASEIAQPLHIFGRGTLERQVQTIARRSDKIVFHGFQSEDVVLDWQRRARWNFCMRYSVGLNQSYFFPSKFFNIIAAPGAVVVNDFYGLPATLRDHVYVVSDDLAQLRMHLPHAATLANRENVRIRREIMRAKHSWKACVDLVAHYADRGAREAPGLN